MGGKRKADNLRLKSIWDESLLSPIMQNEQHRSKLWKWLIQHPTTVMDDIPFDKWNLPRNAIQFVKENFVVYTSKIVDKHESIRGDTVKLLIELQDGHQVETVIMRHPAHSTVCVSSQIGCQMGCRCANI